MSEKKPRGRPRKIPSTRQPPWGYGPGWISSFEYFGAKITLCRECYTQIRVWKSSWPDRLLCHDCLALNWQRRRMLHDGPVRLRIQC